jgi:hypothetical protein
VETQWNPSSRLQKNPRTHHHNNHCRNPSRRWTSLSSGWDKSYPVYFEVGAKPGSWQACHEPSRGCPKSGDDLCSEVAEPTAGRLRSTQPTNFAAVVAARPANPKTSYWTWQAVTCVDRCPMDMMSCREGSRSLMWVQTKAR